MHIWQSLTLGATDTATTTLTWALTLLLNNREILKKAQNELELNVGRERQVRESDIKNLPYLQCIIKETLRLYPPVPLLLPHEAPWAGITYPPAHVSSSTPPKSKETRTCGPTPTNFFPRGSLVLVPRIWMLGARISS
ncbi:hypothetical protein TIFTF001_040181 [Ficus carica]|uniref:Cytochrome P450 n=1 Tax=Ficus carica TaxID=3494 RepID=A0AA87YSX7_FICCA|nr:hypothetical protein TIFTF001_040175 [Ficus carica]GMN22108.1 hypothetical protein TIFTF001_040181 [Ficus carica]